MIGSQAPPSHWGCVDLPHASKQLHQPTIPKGDPHNQIGFRNPARTHVDQAQHKGRQCEGAQAQGSRVGKFTVFDAFVQPRLELAAKGRETAIVADVGERAVAEARSGDGGLVLLVSHLATQTVDLGGVVDRSVWRFVIHLFCAWRVVAGVVGIHCLSSHFGRL